MSLGQLLLLVLIVAVVWLAAKLRDYKHRIRRLEGKEQSEPSED